MTGVQNALTDCSEHGRTIAFGHFDSSSSDGSSSNTSKAKRPDSRKTLWTHAVSKQQDRIVTQCCLVTPRYKIGRPASGYQCPRSKVTSQFQFRIQIEEALKQVGRKRAVMIRIEDAVVRFLSVSGVMLVVWHTASAPVATPFLISPLLLFLVVITMRLLCPPDAEIRPARIGPDPIKRTKRRTHRGQA